MFNLHTIYELCASNNIMPTMICESDISQCQSIVRINYVIIGVRRAFI